MYRIFHNIYAPLVRSDMEKNNEKEIIACLRIIRSHNIGIQGFQTLTEAFGSASEAIDRLPEILKKTGNRKNVRLCTIATAAKELEETQKIGGRIVTIYCKQYPHLLKAIPLPPPVLTILGNEISDNSIAVVGSRTASFHGLSLAKQISKDFGSKGFTTISGLASGIDTAVHIGSVSNGYSTVAVMGSGIDYVYPYENKGLYEQIKEAGTIVTEFPIKTLPKPHYFVQRNRIISGLSIGTLVIEAAINSGSLTTANYALDQGREVFAVPGFPLDTRHRGTNNLIKNGAILVEDAEDVVNNLQYSKIPRKHANISLFDMQTQDDFKYSNKNVSTKQKDSEKEIELLKSKIISMLSLVPIHVDIIIRELSVETCVVMRAVLELELECKLQRNEVGQVVLTEVDA